MFLQELDRAVEAIGQHPERYSTYELGTRRMILRKFPYLVVFRETAAGVEIIAALTDAVARAIGGIGLNDAGAFVVPDPSGRGTSRE